MTIVSMVKLFSVSFLVLSLVALTVPLNSSSGFLPLPSLAVAHANLANNEPWYPAGPATDTVTYKIFADENAEFGISGLQGKTIDITDWPIDDQSLINQFQAAPDFFVTNPISDAAYFELEFMMAQNYWGCNFNFGNAQCGTDIRQAFAHAVDKNIFISQELGNKGVSIDNPAPPVSRLNAPNPCGWDPLFPQTGPQCVVNSPGGTAYHLAPASSCNVPGGCATNVPDFPYVQGLGTPDFCAAADHLIHAGLATGASATLGTINGVPNLHLPGTGSCVLTGISPAVEANPIHPYVRSDNTVRLHLGQGYAEFICALFTGFFTVGCPNAGVIFNLGPITAFPGYSTSPTTIQSSWWTFTSGFSSQITYDSSLYFGYHSRFVSGISSIKQSGGGYCDNAAVASYSAGNYMYLCNATYDGQMDAAEFSPCLTTPGDPVTGQITPTFANCPGSTQLTAASASYQAQDTFGRQAYTIPWYSGKNAFAYQNNGWNRITLQKGNGFEPNTNFFTLLNAHQVACPPTCPVFRQGYKESTGSVNPFIGNTIWDSGVINAIFDAPGALNPDYYLAYMDWMTYSTDLKQPATTANLGYTPPAGTVAAFRYTLRNDIFFHTGQKMTAWDLAFSYIAYKSAGVTPGVAPMTGIKVLSPTQVDIDVNGIGPFTKLFLSASIIPGRNWSGTCTGAQWDAAVANTNFLTADAAVKPCIAPPASISPSGVITGPASNVDQNKIAPYYDPTNSANSNLIGSGPFTCVSPTAVIGGDCTSSHNQAPPIGGTWTLSRNGIGTVPGQSLNTYFRSSGNLALYAWTGNTGRADSTDFINFSMISGPQCYAKPVGTTGCTRWQHGIGGTAAGVVIGLTQVSIVQRFYQLNWVAPYDWQLAPPQNIATPYPPVLYEGTSVLNPCRIDPVNGYDC